MSFWDMLHFKREVKEGQQLRAKADELTLQVDARIARRRKVRLENHLGENVKKAMGG